MLASPANACRGISSIRLPFRYSESTFLSRRNAWSGICGGEERELSDARGSQVSELNTRRSGRTTRLALSWECSTDTTVTFYAVQWLFRLFAIFFSQLIVFNCILLVVSGCLVVPGLPLTKKNLFGAVHFAFVGLPLAVNNFSMVVVWTCENGVGGFYVVSHCFLSLKQ